MATARTTIARVAAVGVLVLPVALALAAGGYFEGSQLRAGLAAWAALFVLALVAPRPFWMGRQTRIALASLAGLAAWTTVSIAWSPLADAALADAERVWLYAVYAAIAAMVLRGRALRWVEPAVAGGATVVACYALATRLLPTVFPSDHSLSAGARLNQPLTYWNALGLLMAMAIVLLLRLAADRSRPAWLRTAAAAAIPLPGLALYLTFSRGALAALAIGVIVLLALCRDRRMVALTLSGLGCAAAAAAAASRFPAVDSLDGTSTKQGVAMLAILIALCTAAAAVQRAIERGVVDRLRVRSATGAAAAILLVVLAVGGAIAVTRSPGGPAPVTRPGVGAVLPRDRARLATLKTNRPAYWKVALEGFADRPLTGVGAHGFQQLWLQKRHISESVQDAHSLYLETAAELGVIGLLLLLGWLGATASAFVRVARAPGGRALIAGPAAASAAYLVHAGLDWDWEMPAVTLPLLALGAVALGAAADQEIRGHRG